MNKLKYYTDKTEVLVIEQKIDSIKIDKLRTRLGIFFFPWKENPNDALLGVEILAAPSALVHGGSKTIHGVVI